MTFVVFLIKGLLIVVLAIVILLVVVMGLLYLWKGLLEVFMVVWDETVSANRQFKSWWRLKYPKKEK